MQQTNNDKKKTKRLIDFRITMKQNEKKNKTKQNEKNIVFIIKQ